MKCEIFPFLFFLVLTAVGDGVIGGFGVAIAMRSSDSPKPYWVPFLAFFAMFGSFTLAAYCFCQWWTGNTFDKGISYNVWVSVFSPLVLCAAALWATVDTWNCIRRVTGCNMQGFYIIVTVSKAFQGLTLRNTGQAVKVATPASKRL